MRGAAAIDLYTRSTLGKRRPVDRPDIFAGIIVLLVAPKANDYYAALGFEPNPRG